jgi:hypothetical protein
MTNLNLKIKRCPYCNYDKFHITFYVKSTYHLIYDKEGKYCESSISENSDEYKRPDKLRCLNCNKSLQRYIIKEVKQP